MLEISPSADRSGEDADGAEPMHGNRYRFGLVVRCRLFIVLLFAEVLPLSCVVCQQAKLDTTDGC